LPSTCGYLDTCTVFYSLAAIIYLQLLSHDFAAHLSAPTIDDEEVKAEHRESVASTEIFSEARHIMIGAHEHFIEEIRELASAHGTEVGPDFVAALANWHMDAVAAARTEIWIPGLTAQSDPLVEELIKRFHLHQFEARLAQLQERVFRLTARQIKLIECARFYAAGSRDGGTKARLALEESLTSLRNRKAHM
jgi:hypothetical protein